jgi:hypothetical protein
MQVSPARERRHGDRRRIRGFGEGGGRILPRGPALSVSVTNYDAFAERVQDQRLIEKESEPLSQAHSPAWIPGPNT